MLVYMGGFKEFIVGVILGIFLGFVFVNSGAILGLSGLTGKAVVQQEQDKPGVIREIVRETIKEPINGKTSCDQKITLIRIDTSLLESELKKVRGKLVTLSLKLGGSQFEVDQDGIDQDASTIRSYREQTQKIENRLDELNSELTQLIMDCKESLV